MVNEKRGVGISVRKQYEIPLQTSRDRELKIVPSVKRPGSTKHHLFDLFRAEAKQAAEIWEHHVERRRY